MRKSVPVFLALPLTVAFAQQPESFPAPDCAKLLAANPPQPVVQLCQAEDIMRAAAALPADAPERLQRWREAGDLYSRAAHLLLDPAHRTYAFDLIARLYDPAYLNDPQTVENALRQLAASLVDTPAPLLRLAQFQEQHIGVEAAEHTLLGARQQFPDGADVFRELSAFYGRRAAALTPPPNQLVAPQPAAAAAAREQSSFKPNCQQFSFGNLGAGLAELCAAEAEVRKGTTAPKGSAERALAFRTAVDLYERAVGSFRTADEKIYVYEAIARVHGQHMNSPADAEQALRQIVALSPTSITPVLRLAVVQEQQQSIDAAESTLLGARQQFANDVELFKALSAFYARRAKPAGQPDASRVDPCCPWP